MDFWQQLGTTIIGAFAGAGAALLTGFWVRRREGVAKERAALNGLLLDLQLKRALATDTPQHVTRAAETTDYKQCKDSVYDSRKLIRDARLQLLPQSKAFDSLASMAAACNSYLRASRIEPDSYQKSLTILRDRLDDEARTLGSLRGVTYRGPGSYAYDLPKSEATSTQAGDHLDHHA